MSSCDSGYATEVGAGERNTCNPIVQLCVRIVTLDRNNNFGKQDVHIQAFNVQVYWVYLQRKIVFVIFEFEQFQIRQITLKRGSGGVNITI